jgi:hypothetical protein
MYLSPADASGTILRGTSPKGLARSLVHARSLELWKMLNPTKKATKKNGR